MQVRVPCPYSLFSQRILDSEREATLQLHVVLLLLVVVDREAQALLQIVVVDLEGELLVEDRRTVHVRHRTRVALQGLLVGNESHLDEDVRRTLMDTFHTYDYVRDTEGVGSRAVSASHLLFRVRWLSEVTRLSWMIPEEQGTQ